MNLIEQTKCLCKNIKVLFCEDEQEARESMLAILNNFFEEIVVAIDGEDGLKKFDNSIELIITDINMPNLSGLDMIEKIKEKKADISTIIISAYQEVEFLQRSIELGVDGYIFKPTSLPLIVKTLNKTCQNIKIKKENEEYRQHLEKMVEEKTKKIIELNKEIKNTQKEIIFILGGVVESRSKETINHVKRVGLYSYHLAKLYGLSDEKAELIKDASPLHDVGKIGIPDYILNKPGTLTEEEFEIMKQHTIIGHNILKGSKLPLLKTAAIIAKEHHENYDGTGYPEGLKGEEISIEGRIVSLADVFDALGSDRVYKKAWKDEEVFKFLKENSGKKFDPKLVEIFFNNLDIFLDIRNQLKD